jgi:hypothetical protein
MSELNERRWTVLSERGGEASGLTYAAAAERVRALNSEKVHGLCIITDAAAARLAAASPAENGGKPKRARKSGTGRRGEKSAR